MLEILGPLFLAAQLARAALAAPSTTSGRILTRRLPKEALRSAARLSAAVLALAAAGCSSTRAMTRPGPGEASGELGRALPSSFVIHYRPPAPGQAEGVPGLAAEAAREATLEGGTLHFVSRAGLRRSVPLSSIDSVSFRNYGQGAGLGALFGVALGAGIGYAGGYHDDRVGGEDLRTGFAFAGGTAGLLLGLATGAMAGQEEVIRLEDPRSAAAPRPSPPTFRFVAAPAPGGGAAGFSLAF